ALAATAASPANPADRATPSNVFPPGGDIPRKFVPLRTEFDYVRREVMIPMRDGVKLHTVLLIPNSVKHGPIVMERTPYGANGFTKRTDSSILGNVPWPSYNELARAGYIIAIQDVRGRSDSEGEYVVTRPLVGVLNPTQVDHATDTWDTI